MSTSAAKVIIHIIDDDEAVRDALSLLLDSVGIENRCYENGKVFIEKYAERQFDHAPGCIILDIRMPKMSGLECQQKLEQMNCHLPIIFVTGHGDVPMAVEAIKRGAIEFIQKPFRDQDLLDRIQRGVELSLDKRASHLRLQAMKNKFSLLTPRERQVMEKIAEGIANKVIAVDLNLT